MLTREEEKRLDTIIKYTERAFEDTFVWLARKLKETNDECSALHLELQKTNEQFAAFVERYEG